MLKTAETLQMSVFPFAATLSLRCFLKMLRKSCRAGDINPVFGSQYTVRLHLDFIADIGDLEQSSVVGFMFYKSGGKKVMDSQPGIRTVSFLQNSDFQF